MMRRTHIVEHAAVMAALAEIAKRERTTIMDLLRESAREAVRRRAQSPDYAAALRSTVWQLEPQRPMKFKTSAQLARFKREQREFDQVVMDMQLAAPEAVQARNPLSTSRPVRQLSYDQGHASFV